MTDQVDCGSPYVERMNPAGRTVLLLATIAAFVSGIFTGYIVAREEASAQGNVLSEETYLVEIKDSPTTGPDGAAVTIVEWSDARCGECNRVDAILRRAVDLFPGEVRVVWRHLLSTPDSAEAKLAAQAAAAAYYHGKFWQMRDRIAAFEGTITIEVLESFAREEGLDAERIRRELEMESYAGKVKSDTDAASSMGIKKVPTIFVNGRLLLGEPTLENVKRAVVEAREEAKGLIARGVAPQALYWELIKNGRSTL